MQTTIFQSNGRKLAMKLPIAMLIAEELSTKSAKKERSKKPLDWLMRLLDKLRKRGEKSSTASASGKDPLIKQGLHQDSDGHLFYVSRLSKDEYLINHETEGSQIINSKGEMVLGKLTSLRHEKTSNNPKNS